jgi:Domain of unknown function (DUF6265)
MTRTSTCIATGLLAFAASAGAQDAGLQRLSWLKGCWEMRRGATTTRETWASPKAGMMLGASRTIVGRTVREAEQLQLTWVHDTLVYTAHPSGQREASFRTTVVTDSGFAVENPAHDFPQRIIYRRRGADSLLARIEGPGPGGTRGTDFPMRRVECAAAAPRR